MAGLSFSKSHDLILHVKCPILDDRTSESATSWAAPSILDSSKWGVTVTRSGPTLSVKVEWYHKDIDKGRHVPEGGFYYYYMHIIPHSNSEQNSITYYTGFRHISGTQSVTGSINVFEVLLNDQYQFDVVMSASKDLSYRTIPKSILSTISTGREMLLSFLKDVHSVDVCFVFTSDQSYSNVGLWAHRVMLSRIKVFKELILKATEAIETTKESRTTKAVSLEDEADDPGQSTVKEEEETSGESSILTIPIDKFSLATMCSILYYIYSGQVQLSITPSQFAISNAGSSLALNNAHGRTRESVRWNRLSTDSDWKLKDVTWLELELAAEFFEMGELETLCEKEVDRMLTESNAIDILFNVGCHSEKVKKQALNFIVGHMESLFAGKNNPFERFRDHPGCQDMLVEVIQAKFAKNT